MHLRPVPFLCLSLAMPPVLAAEGPPMSTSIEADDPMIRFVGRVDFSNPKAPEFSFPGVAILARFQGTRLDVILSDTGTQDYFNVQIDGQEPVVIQTKVGRTVFPVARNLADTEHTVRIAKRTESSCGVARFHGFQLDPGKTLGTPPRLPNRKMEFIGDSITCGYGNKVSTLTPDLFHFNPANEDADLAWGSVVARTLDAQVVLTAYSGRGMFRNNTGSEEGTIPALYRSIFADEPHRAAWDPSRYVPDVIVLNLGTNDFSALLAKTDLTAEVLDQRFGATYRTFLETLRTLYGPSVKIVCVVGPMMNDGYPPGARAWSRVQKTVSTLVLDLNKTDPNVSYWALPPQSPPFGEDWHPTVATHAQMAQDLVSHLQDILGWN